MHILVVGAGFAGATVARVLADAGHRLTLIDIRHHLGGNAYDYHDEYGVLVHRYGPHIFHTNSERVFTFLSRFTAWRAYEHRVLSCVQGQHYPIPINRKTMSMLEGREMSEQEAAEFIECERVPIEHPKNSEEVVLNSVGPKLRDLFFSGYTRKQWGLDLKDLSAGVAARIPTRTNDDDRYFTDRFQCMPAHGYTAMFEAMLRHPSIEIRLGIDYFKVKHQMAVDHTVYTGPIDVFFDACFGKLPYRSLRFEHKHIEHCVEYQPVGTVNFPNDHAYTRITEMKKLTGQSCSGTSIVMEFPTAEGDPYYPIPRPENEDLYRRYAALAENQDNVSFTGRLAQYRYYNMDQVVAASLALGEKLAARMATTCDKAA